MLEQPKLLRRPLPPKLLPPLPPSTSRQTNHIEMTPWTKQPIEKISSTEEIIEKERKVHILDYLPNFPPPENRKARHAGFPSSLHAPTPPVSINTPNVCEAKEQKSTHVIVKKQRSDQNEARSLVEPSKHDSPEDRDYRTYSTHLLKLVDDVLPHQLSPQFSLEDLLAKSADHVFVKENLKKPLISRSNYNMLVKRLTEELQRNKQSKVNEVIISFDDIKKTSVQAPWRQILLEPKMKTSYSPDESGELNTERKFENNGENKIPQSFESKHFPDAKSTHLQAEQKKSMEFITPAEMAVLKSLLHEGLTLSLKAYFLNKLPDLTPLNNNLLYLNLSFNDLAQFPRQVYNIENLQVLKLRNNPMKEIPLDIHRLRNLRTFVISFCLISSLPLGIFFLQHLQFLDVSYNSISFLPNDICNLRELDFLNVEGNELPALPCGALKLPLKQLRVANNYMHPLLWKENSWTQPQRLTELAALFFSKSNLWQRYTELPIEVEKIMNNYIECDCCNGPRYGQGIRIIKPYEKIFGISKLPFIFYACSSSCYKNFLSHSSSPTEGN
ncbi:leucine-rich repeat-containing protein 63 isoform X2 [Rhinatrema bivittatum]|uniref:leucine-rich repeat-containing protein 63 isoform X2 n=1 Tax=Rhinatrema bivittatum TaxID=194408 RepID=UPI001125C51F|nr:leucine-rich repeat-containing protein 63 isoform X2 [Rhinatrema bivittatum]